MVPARAAGAPDMAGAVPPFAVGERVFHQKFGMGTVSSVDGDKLQISFDKAGSKKLVASFVSKP